MRIRPLPSLLACVTALVLGAPAGARADDALPAMQPEPWGLELSFTHGVSWASHPGSDIELVSGQLGLDARLLSPMGLGVVVRAGFFALPAPLALELDVGAAYRAWIAREGPRGAQIGGALGLSAVLWNGNPRRPGALGEACVLDGGMCVDPYDERWGAFATVSVDYREHAMHVGVALLGRWLPGDLAGEDERLGFFWLAALARVGGEIEL